MERVMIHDLIDRYINLTHDVWKLGEVLFQDQIGSDLTNDQQYLLRYMYRRGQCTSTELADVFYVQKSAITAIINRLVEKSLIERRSDPNDRRIILLSLTEKGEALFLQTQERINNVVESFITQFDQKEIENFLHTYEKLSKILKEMKGTTKT